LPQKWSIWFAVEGDLRFASHHDMMRLLARLASRAHLPVRFSQGYNPRPILSLACPRPVGVATRCDLLVTFLDAPRGRDEDEKSLLEKLAASAPPGLRFLRAKPLEGKAAPQPGRIDYERPVSAELAAIVSRRLDELAATDCWPMERQTPAKRGGKVPEARSFNIRPLLTDIRLEGGMLRWSHVCHGKMWARPGEFLRLLGMGDPADLACVTRTHVEYEN